MLSELIPPLRRFHFLRHLKHMPEKGRSKSHRKRTSHNTDSLQGGEAFQKGSPHLLPPQVLSSEALLLL